MTTPQKPYHAFYTQQERIKERKQSATITRTMMDRKLVIYPGVYDLGPDTQLLSEIVAKLSGDTFIEVGCGAGALLLEASSRFKTCYGGDINQQAVNCAKENIHAHGLDNVSIMLSNVLTSIPHVADVVVFNPPYNSYTASDTVEAMFWDTKDTAKKLFWQQVGEHLSKDGSILFGWANFNDLDSTLPNQLAKEAGYKETQRWEKKHKDRTFYVIEFIRDLH
jgi:methylase of polypeptide subunit release factors